MIDLSIVIVSYNTKEFLLKCISSIFASKKDKITIEIIVVDNASSDVSVSALNHLASQNKNLTIIANKNNTGFSKANNSGVKKAKGRYILFLNPDTIVHENSLSAMVAFMDVTKDAGVATCKLFLSNGKLDDASHRGFPTPWNALCYFLGLSKLFPATKLFSGYTLGWMNLDVTHEIDACAGAFMIVRKEAGEEVKWWDEDFFWYGDDLDFCYRLKQKNWKIYYVPTVSVLHYKGVSGGIKDTSKHLTTADSQTRLQATKARFAAMDIFYKKHYKNKYPKFITWIVTKAVRLKLYFALQRIY